MKKKRVELKTRFEAHHDQSVGVRCAARAFRFLSHDLTQFLVYVVYIYMFQLMSNYLRDSSEHFNAKYIADVLLEEPFHKELDDETFHSVAQVEDIYDWHDNVLWPALLKDRLPDDSAYLSPTEMAEQMDRFDWSAGISFVQLRAQKYDDSNCGAVEYASVPNMYREAYKRQGLEFTSSEAKPRHSSCIPNFDFQMSTLLENNPKREKYAIVDTEPFGIDLSDYQLLAEPFRYYDADALGANPDGQRSGSVDINFGSIPTGGHASFVIPFFSNKLLPEERGDWTEVTDYRLYSADASSTPRYFCVRVSWNGAYIHQMCDPNDSTGLRTTGNCTQLVRDFWAQMKAARYIDAQTRALTITLPLRNNNVGLRLRLAMVFQVTSAGAVLPSYDIESRKDVFDAEGLARIQLTTICLCVYFVLTEVYELHVLGFGYFANMWNLMDWTNFVLYAMLYRALNLTSEALKTTTCSTICQQVGYVDPWKVLMENTYAKLYLGILTMIQWIKVIKFINILVPKFSLATSVLSHALADLLLFMIVFMWAIASFAQMFYMQLGPYMRGYSSFFLAVLTLMRSLFGDFDIDAILMASNSYVNVVVFMMYLFFAVFILLSIFLTILGEHQEAIESQKRAIKETKGKLPHYLEWGVFGEAKDFIGTHLNSLHEHVKEIQKHHPKMNTALSTLTGPLSTVHVLPHAHDSPHSEVVASVVAPRVRLGRKSARAKSPTEKLKEAMDRSSGEHSNVLESHAESPAQRRRGGVAALVGHTEPLVVPLWGFQTHASRLDAVAAQLEREVRECEEGFLAQHNRWPSAAEMGKVATSAERLTELTELRELLRAKAAELLSGSPADRAVASLGGTQNGTGPPPLPEVLGVAEDVSALTRGGGPRGSDRSPRDRSGRSSPRSSPRGSPPRDQPTDVAAAADGRVAMRRSPRE